MLESYLPQDFYLNRWTNLQPKAEGQFHASPEEIKRAALTRDKRYLRKEITKQKYVLFRAILENDVDACKKLLRTPLLLERHTSEGTTPLGLAAATGNAAIVSFLLDLGADVNARDRTGATPLHLAALLGHTDIIKMLLESKQGGTTGRDYLLRQGSHSGETPVMAAAKGGSVDALKELAKAGGETGTTCSVSGCSGVDCLMLASRHDRVETMKWLLERGLQPTRRDDIGRDALMHACCTGSLQAAELLLKSQPLGADLSARDSKGYSALHHACLGGNLRLVELLNDKLSGSNSINFTAGPEGGQLLCLACDAGQAGVAEWLLSNKAGKLEIVSEGPQNPLHAAVHAGRTEIIEVLLASGARIDVRDARGRTPLAWAATHGKDDMVRLLVSKGASMLSVDLHGRVPRQLAYLHRHWDLANMLSEMAKSRYFVADADDTFSDLALAAAIHDGLLHGDGGDRGNLGVIAASIPHHAVHGRQEERHLHQHPTPSGRPGSPGLRTQKEWVKRADVKGAVLAGTPLLPGWMLHPHKHWDAYGKLQLASSGKNGFRNVHAERIWLPVHPGPG